MEYIDTQFNVFQLYPDINRYLDGRFLSVNTNYRGAGLAGKLTQRSLEYIQEKSIPLMLVSCSSYYSARVCEKLGFKEVYQLPFKNYVVNGENPLLPADPHKAIKIFVKKLE